MENKDQESKELTVEQKLDILASQVNLLNAKFSTLVKALGINVNVSKDGLMSINIPPQKEGVGVLANLYWDVVRLKKENENPLIYRPH